MTNNNVTKLADVMESVRQRLNTQDKVTVYRFDIFKGKQDQDGKVVKIKSVGSAYLRDGLKTYTVNLKTLLGDKFYLLPNSKPEMGADFVILTREPAQNLGRKYFWNNVGDGRVLDGPNAGIMRLTWDIFAGDIYMNLHPRTSLSCRKRRKPTRRRNRTSRYIQANSLIHKN